MGLFNLTLTLILTYLPNFSEISEEHLRKKTSCLIDTLSFASDYNSNKTKKRAMQIRRNRERSKSVKETFEDKDKFKLLEKKQYAESIESSPNSFLERAINQKTSSSFVRRGSLQEHRPAPVTDNKEIEEGNDHELVISDLDANVNEKEEGSSTPLSMPLSSSSGSNSFIPMKNKLQKKTQSIPAANQDNATPSYLLLMQYLGEEHNEENNLNSTDLEKIKLKYSDPNLPTHLVYISIILD